MNELPEALPDEMAPEGRVTVLGTIEKIKQYQDTFSPQGGIVRKMLLKLENGSKVFCALPKSIRAAKPGDLIKVTATWERKEPQFSFGSRPKADFFTP